jgi:hypothetical protein
VHVEPLDEGKLISYFTGLGASPSFVVSIYISTLSCKRITSSIVLLQSSFVGNRFPKEFPKSSKTLEGQSLVVQISVDFPLTLFRVYLLSS